MELKVSVSEALTLIKEIENVPAKIFEYIGMSIQKEVGSFLSNLMGKELTDHIGREKYERKDGATDYRNGSYTRTFCIKGIGDVEVRVPGDRDGDFQSQVLPKAQRYDERITEDLAAMYLTGISTRTLSLLTKRLIGRSLSATEVSNAATELKQSAETWRNRDLSGETIKYLFIDGVNFRMRIGKSIEPIPILVVIGVREDGTKLVLGLQGGDKESAATWRQFFKDLKGRGLKGSTVTLGIMDGLSGLEKVFEEEFSIAKIQRCQVHVARNVIAKVPKAQARGGRWSPLHLLCVVKKEGRRVRRELRRKVGEGYSFSSEVPRQLPRHLSDLLLVPGRGVDIAPDDQRDRTTQQGVQEKDEAYGDRRRGECLLSTFGVHIVEDGDELEGNEDREGASQFAPL